MAASKAAHDTDVRTTIETVEEGRAIFDQRARELVGMSGEEFLRKWDAGEIDDPDRSEIVRLVLMIPLNGRAITMP